MPSIPRGTARRRRRSPSSELAALRAGLANRPQCGRFVSPPQDTESNPSSPLRAGSAAPLEKSADPCRVGANPAPTPQVGWDSDSATGGAHNAGHPLTIISDPHCLDPFPNSKSPVVQSAVAAGGQAARTKGDSLHQTAATQSATCGRSGRAKTANLARVGLLDRRSFNRGVFLGKRAQNHALCWAESGSGWERIMNADLPPRLIAFPVLTHRLAR